MEGLWASRAVAMEGVSVRSSLTIFVLEVPASDEGAVDALEKPVPMVDQPARAN
ncbi:hypothetical protein FH972_024531 [Carpinus fangiana]|uniref:Uncharacterized protein n=1 Tax=Carpinus fangiana TaxID=176857 RepID=A0A5N6KZ76_9ROSI|nr:hypothetical protein FH972_024531 [Carpinus fangiana]